MTTKSVKFLAAAVQREMMPQMTIAPGRNSAGLPTLLRNKLLGTCMRMYLQVTVSWFCSRGLKYPMLASQCDSDVLLLKPKGRAPKGTYPTNRMLTQVWYCELVRPRSSSRLGVPDIRAVAMLFLSR